MIKKRNLSDVNEVRKLIRGGIDKMEDLVSLTCGPDGLSVMIERGAGEPLIVDDGRRVAENIKLDDEIEQLAVRTCYEVTKKADEKAGDGTTRAMIYARGIVDSVFDDHLPAVSFAKARTSVREIDERIHTSCENVLKLLTKMAKPVKTEQELIDVATIISGDAKIGEIVGKMYFELGPNGHITLEFNLLSDQIETEMTKGMRLTAGMAKSWMIGDKLRGRTVLDNIETLLVNRKDLTAKHIEGVVEQIQLRGKNKLLIIGRRFTQEFLNEVYLSAKANVFGVLCVQFPQGGIEHYEDVAVFTGGKAFQEQDNLDDIKYEHLGHVNRFDASEEETILIEGKGTKEALEKRIKEVEKEMKEQKLHQFKQARQERISALSGGVGVIKIGAPTDEERNWLKYKIEDAKLGTKVAYRDGVVQGGGLAMVKIAEGLPEDDILKKALMRPHEILKRNAGGEFKVGKDVIDPVGVEKAAIQTACSAASKLIRIGGAVSFKGKPTLDEAMSGIITKKGDNGELIEEDEDAQ